MEESMPPVDTQLELIGRCLGLPSIDPTSADDDNTKASAAAAVTEASSLPAGFLLTPKLIHTISCKWKKDKKPCGITDIALTDDGRVFVADFLNKAVKVYDSIQVQIVIII